MSKQSWISFPNNFAIYFAFQLYSFPCALSTHSSLICTIRVNPSDVYLLVGLILLFPQSIHVKYFSFFDMMILCVNMVLFVFIIITQCLNYLMSFLLPQNDKTSKLI